MKKHRFGTFISLLAIIAACSPQKAPAAQAVETYLRALAGKDEARLVSLTCGEWEAEALLEYDAFTLVETSLKDLDCQQTGSGGDAALVTCRGSIQATYQNEVQQFDLGGRLYRVVQQGGDWLICGYTR